MKILGSKVIKARKEKKQGYFCRRSGKRVGTRGGGYQERWFIEITEVGEEIHMNMRQGKDDQSTRKREEVKKMNITREAQFSRRGEE